MYPSKTIPLADWMTDVSTSNQLLPSQYRRNDNARRLHFCRHALYSAMDKRLSPVQRRRVEQHFLQGLSKSEIARRESSSCSAVGKSLHSAEEAIREYTAMYMEIYDTLERALLNETW